MIQSTVRHSNSFWIDEKHDFITSFLKHPRIIHAELSTNNDEYDVVVIGTGLSGVSCVYWLRKLYPVERFPRITMCKFIIRTLGDNIQPYDVQCLLPINIYNEKVIDDIFFSNQKKKVEIF